MNTYTPTRAEKAFIKKNFRTEELFYTYCSDFVLLNTMEDVFLNDECIFSNTTTSGMNGITTGIVLDVDFDKTERKFQIVVLAEGERHLTEADDITTTNLLSASKRIIKNPGNWSEEDIESFAFLWYKPFILRIIEGKLTLIDPLDTNLYEEAINLIDKFDRNGYLPHNSLDI